MTANSKVEWRFQQRSSLPATLPLAVSAGGLVWYMQHSKAVEEQKRMELLAAKTAEAKDAIQTTLKSSRDFADLVME